MAKKPRSCSPPEKEEPIWLVLTRLPRIPVQLHQLLQRIWSIKLTICTAFGWSLSSLLSLTLLFRPLSTSKTKSRALQHSLIRPIHQLFFCLRSDGAAGFPSLSRVFILDFFFFQPVLKKYQPKMKNDVLQRRGTILRGTGLKCICWYAWLFIRNIYKLIIRDRWGFIFPCVFCLCCLGPHFKDRNLASIFLFNSEAEASKRWTLICNCLDESGQINANVLLFCRNLLSCPDWSRFSAAPRNLSQLPPQLH